MIQKPYLVDGNSQSDQAEHSSEQPLAGNVQMRILVELQVQTYLMVQDMDYDGDIGELRQSIADSIT